MSPNPLDFMSYVRFDDHEEGNPTVRGNRISKNGSHAIRAHDGGGGVIEDNDLRDNTRGAWNIASDCEDKVKRKGNQE